MTRTNYARPVWIQRYSVGSQVTCTIHVHGRQAVSVSVRQGAEWRKAWPQALQLAVTAFRASR